MGMPAEPPSDIHSAVAAALDATKDETDVVKSAAVSAAVAAIPPPSARTTSVLWLILVTVLSGVVLASAIASVIYALENKASPPDVLITIFTTSFSGLIGLFVKPPNT
jgi:hypothetical protein